MNNENQDLEFYIQLKDGTPIMTVGDVNIPFLVYVSLIDAILQRMNEDFVRYLKTKYPDLKITYGNELLIENTKSITFKDIIEGSRVGA